MRHSLQLSTARNDDGSRDDLLSLSVSKGVIPKVYDDESQVRSGDELRKYFLVRPGQLVVNPMWLMHGSLGTADVHGVISPDYRVYDLAPGISPRYVHHLLKTREYQDLYGLLARGTTTYDRRISKDAFNDLPLLLPPLATQKAIADFLDRKTAAIDELIAKKQRLLDLLAEKRAALINQAVTKGLDPSVPMKDSGIPWIGEIPVHWEVKRLRYTLDRSLRNGLFKKKDQFGSGTALVNVGDMYSDNFQVNWSALDRVETTTSEERTFEARHGDIFFVRSSLKLEGVAASACLVEPPETTVFECHLVGARPDLSEVDPVFLVNYLNSPLVRQRLVALSTTTTMTTIAQDRIADLTVPVPPLGEGRTIADHIERTHEVLAAAEASITDQLDRLSEFRQAVITEAVTGALDVEVDK